MLVRMGSPRGAAPGAPQANARPAGRGAAVLRPHTRDPATALRADPRGADPLLLAHISVALDQQLAAARAPRMLPAPDAARPIDCVDALEAGRRHDPTMPHQAPGRRSVGVGPTGVP